MGFGVSAGLLLAGFCGYWQGPSSPFGSGRVCPSPMALETLSELPCAPQSWGPYVVRVRKLRGGSRCVQGSFLEGCVHRVAFARWCYRAGSVTNYVAPGGLGGACAAWPQARAMANPKCVGNLGFWRLVEVAWPAARALPSACLVKPDKVAQAVVSGSVVVWLSREFAQSLGPGLAAVVVATVGLRHRLPCCWGGRGGGLRRRLARCLFVTAGLWLAVFCVAWQAPGRLAPERRGGATPIALEIRASWLLSPSAL